MAWVRSLSGVKILLPARIHRGVHQSLAFYYWELMLSVGTVWEWGVNPGKIQSPPRIWTQRGIAQPGGVLAASRRKGAWPGFDPSRGENPSASQNPPRGSPEPCLLLLGVDAVGWHSLGVGC